MGYQIFNAIYVLVRNFTADQNWDLDEQRALTLVHTVLSFNFSF